MKYLGKAEKLMSQSLRLNKVFEIQDPFELGFHCKCKHDCYILYSTELFYMYSIPNFLHLMQQTVFLYSWKLHCDWKVE